MGVREPVTIWNKIVDDGCWIKLLGLVWFAVNILATALRYPPHRIINQRTRTEDQLLKNQVLRQPHLESRKALGEIQLELWSAIQQNPRVAVDYVGLWGCISLQLFSHSHCASPRICWTCCWAASFQQCGWSGPAKCISQAWEGWSIPAGFCACRVCGGRDREIVWNLDFHWCLIVFVCFCMLCFFEYGLATSCVDFVDFEAKDLPQLHLCLAKLFRLLPPMWRRIQRNVPEPELLFNIAFQILKIIPWGFNSRWLFRIELWMVVAEGL